jgi:hypothetical protein
MGSRTGTEIRCSPMSAGARTAAAGSRRHVGELVERLRRWTSSRAFLPIAVAVATFTIAGAALGWATYGGKPTLKLELTFSEDACCSLQVWVNGTTSKDITALPIEWGTRETYSVPLLAPRVHRLRLPVGEVPGSTVTIRKIWIARGSRTVDEVGRDELRRITAEGATVRAVPEGVQVTVTDRHPFLDLPADLDTRQSRLRLGLVEIAAKPLRWVVALLVGGSLLLLAMALPSSRALVGLASAAVTLLAVYELPRLMWQLPVHDSVAESVGFSSYTGVWKTRERYALYLVALAAVATPLALTALRRLRRGSQEQPTAVVADAPFARPLRGTHATALVAAPIVLIALVALPSLDRLLREGRQLEYVPSWDGNNLVFWRYLVQTTDLAPMEDFFWPYGLQWLFHEPSPWGEVLSYFTYLSFWAFLSLGSYLALARFFSGRALALRVAVVTGFWLSIAMAGHVSFATRYIAPLALVLLFAGIDERAGSWSWKRVVFAVALLGATLFEVAQAAYALVPIAFLLGLESALQIRSSRGEALRRLGLGAATLVAPLVIAVGVLAATGDLGATIAYYAELDALVGAYGWPAPIDFWVKHPTDFAGGIFWAFALTIALGVSGLVAAHGRSRVAHGVVTALGLLGLMVMQKQVLRPPIEAQMWLPVVFGLVFWASVETASSGRRRWATVGALGGTFVALILASGGYGRGWDGIAGSPTRLRATISAILFERPEFAAQTNAAFEPSRFRKFTMYTEVVERLRDDAALSAGGPLWILGDDTPITMMLGRTWPYYFNDLYDTSPIGFQKKVLGRLERTRPARVVWNFSPEAMVFDTVPHVVRVPLLYEWAVTHLVPMTIVGHFAILRPRRPGEPIALDWWRRRIGPTVDLGHVPELARLGEEACAGGPRCGTFVVIELDEAVPRPPDVRFPVTVDGLRFEVELQTAASASRYVVPLDRLWFWSAGASSARSVGDAKVPGASIAVVRRERDSGRLY